MRRAVEREAVEILKDEYEISDVGETTCPEDQLVTPGNSFVCIMSVRGADKSVEVTSFGFGTAVEDRKAEDDHDE